MASAMPLEERKPKATHGRRSDFIDDLTGMPDAPATAADETS
jgi:hypothetical protein